MLYFPYICPKRGVILLIINVLSYLEASAARVPDRICWADAAAALTYREAWSAVCKMGTALSARLATVNAPVCVLLRHDVTDLLAFFSVVYSGNFYVPIDPALPPVRLRSMLETLTPAAVLTAGGSLDAALTQGIPVLSQTELLAENAAASAAPPWKQRKDTDLLYVIFTSGSTGEPKGVSVCHRSVIDMVEQFMLAFAFADGAVWGNQAPFDFDVSVKDIFLSLKVGGRLEILEKKLFSFPKLLIERLNERTVDTVIWAVPALKIISRLNAFKTLRPLYLKNIMFSGEVMPPKTLQYWMQAVPQARFVNLYGPTEITCNCTYHIVQNADEVLREVPIGRPFANCDVFLLDGDEPIRAEGRMGEICVTGSCLALGYYNRPLISAQAFVQNPLNSKFREPMYRTGDLGVWRDGRLLFAGRKDTQIKYMGHRIEMSEIELCANAAEGVEASACVYCEELARLTLFYTGAAEEKVLLAHLRDRLPKYMLPSVCRRLERFPQNRTGKIDRRALLILSKEG